MTSDGLLTGETLLWRGQPERGIRLRTRDLLHSAVGALILAVSVCIEVVTFHQHETLFITLWIVPFMLGGAYECFGRLILDAYIRSRTSYVLTDRRAIFEIDALIANRQYVLLRGVHEVAIEERSDGLGTITFGRDLSVPDGEGNKTTYAPCFEFIRDPQRVFLMVQNARN